MAAGSNPLGGGGGGVPQGMARSIIDTLSSRGASPMQQGGTTGGSAQTPEAMSQLLASRMSELEGADPKAVQRLIMEMKQKTAVLIPQLAFRIPGVAKHLSTLFSTYDKILEEIEKALSTQQAVANTPIGGSMSAIQPGSEPNTTPKGPAMNLPGLGA